MRTCFGQLTVVFLEDDLSVLQHQQPIDVPFLRNFVDALLATVIGNRKVIDEIPAALECSDAVNVMFDPGCRQAIGKTSPLFRTTDIRRYDNQVPVEA